MKKIVSLFMVMLAFGAYANAQDKVEITQRREHAADCPPQHLIPVDVDIDRSLLGIHFRERVEDVNVSVSGPDGVVYHEWFTTPAARSVEVDLSPYRDGQYEILFFDAEGNEAEGSFVKEDD